MDFALINKKFGKIAFILTVILFLWISTFGLLYHINEMKTEVAKGDCLFSGQTEVCAMNFSEHIALWQGMFTILPQNIGLFGVLILVIILFAVVAFWQNYFFKFFKHLSSRFRFYIKQHSQNTLYKIKITNWLSLFENSPSFTYVRYS